MKSIFYYYSMNTLPIFDRELLLTPTEGNTISLGFTIDSQVYSDICELMAGEGKYTMESLWLAMQYYTVGIDPARIRPSPNMCVYLYLIESTYGGVMETYLKSESVPKQFCVVDRTCLPCPEQTLSEIVAFYLEYDGGSAWQRNAECYLPTIHPWGCNIEPSCEPIDTFSWESVAPQPILPEDIALDRLKMLADGIFWEADSHFDWTGVCIAGGACSKAVDSQASIREQQLCDIDLFIYGLDLRQRKGALQRTLRWFQKYQPYYLINGSVCTIYIMNSKRKYQIVFSNDTSIMQVLQRFDFTHVGWAYDGNTIVATPGAVRALATRVTRLNRIKRFEFNRCVKALRNKYAIANDSTSQLFIDTIQQAIDKNSAMVKQAVLKSLLVYYPHEDGIWQSLDETDREQYIIQKIMEDAGTNNMYRIADEAYGAINVYGNFSDDYGVSSFRNFSINNVSCKPVSRRITRVLLRGNRGSFVNILTDAIDCTIIGGNIVGVVTPELVKLFDTMDTKVYKIYSRRQIAVRSVVDSRVTFVPREGKQLLFKSNKGDKLDTPDGTFRAKVKFSVEVDIENCKMNYIVNVAVLE